MDNSGGSGLLFGLLGNTPANKKSPDDSCKASMLGTMNGRPTQEIRLFVISIVSGIMKWLCQLVLADNFCSSSLRAFFPSGTGTAAKVWSGISASAQMNTWFGTGEISYGCAQFCFSSHGAMPRAAIKLTSGW